MTLKDHKAYDKKESTRAKEDLALKFSIDSKYFTLLN